MSKAKRSTKKLNAGPFANVETFVHRKEGQPMWDGEVQLIDVGQPHWPRRMIYHEAMNLYWGQGEWRSCRREGELWLTDADAFEAVLAARESCRMQGDQDE